uniref:Uncharacterized protein n=1 Tax=Oryza punctata TaxID=4537 RepID=A0A0E0K8E5_ORYPU
MGLGKKEEDAGGSHLSVGVQIGSNQEGTPDVGPPQGCHRVLSLWYGCECDEQMMGMQGAARSARPNRQQVGQPLSPYSGN